MTPPTAQSGKLRRRPHQCLLGHLPRRSHGTSIILGADRRGLGWRQLDYRPRRLSTIVNGNNLTYVWKYRNRWFFIEGRLSMNAWFLPLNAIGGQLSMIPLSGSGTKGGKLIAKALAWSIDAGDGMRRQMCFYDRPGRAVDLHRLGSVDNGEQLAQEGRYRHGAAARHECLDPDRWRRADCHRRGHHSDLGLDHQGHPRNSSWPPITKPSSRCGATRSTSSARCRGRCANGTSTAPCS